MRLLIPGGAGYIGSHMVKYAQDKGHEVVVLDNFSTGHEWAVMNARFCGLICLTNAS
jgi:UDP-glucose 4-epimerase